VTDINGTLVPRGDGRWLMAVQFVPDRGVLIRPDGFIAWRHVDSSDRERAQDEALGRCLSTGSAPVATRADSG
jgi:hypothetical protein